jgi:hypothetical protein
MKINRYDVDRDGDVYLNDDGDYVWYDDVKILEEENFALKNENKKLTDTIEKLARKTYT